MSIVAVVGVGLLTAAACVLLKQYNPLGSLVAAMAGGVILLFGVTGFATDLVELVSGFINQTQLDFRWFSLLLKVLGISYVCKFGTDLCRDAGESAVAGYVEIAGKVILVALSLPYLLELVDTVTELIKQ
jgi:stage III sporulation protein AD